MPSNYYHEIEMNLICASDSRSSLSRVMESVDKNMLSLEEYDELFRLYESLWESVVSSKKKKELYSDYDYANLSSGGDLDEF